MRQALARPLNLTQIKPLSDNMLEPACFYMHAWQRRDAQHPLAVTRATTPSRVEGHKSSEKALVHSNIKLLRTLINC